MPFWQFFRQGWDGHALLVRPLRISHRISKILFALCADEFLGMLEGKIRVTPFFKVQSGKITVRIGITDNKTTTKIRLFRLRTLSRETALNSLYVKFFVTSLYDGIYQQIWRQNYLSNLLWVQFDPKFSSNHCMT